MACIGLVGLTAINQAIADESSSFREQLKAGKLTSSLDPLVDIPALWAITPEQIDRDFSMPDGIEMNKNPYFSWMTKTKDRAVFMRQPFSDLTIDFSIFGGEVPVEEAVVDFAEGKLNGISFSLYNRGDSGKIDATEFQRRLKLSGQKMSALLGVRPSPRKANPTQGLLAEGWTWVSAKGMAVLEHNPEATQGEAEFLRLKIAPRTATGVFAASFQGRSSAVRLSELPKNVVKSADGDVYIKGIPMVDQGPKGYCVVASAQRLFEYYGIPADQHQIAQVAGSDAEEGTGSHEMSAALGKIDYRFKTRFKIHAMAHEGALVTVNEREMTVGRDFSQDQFNKLIRSSIDSGIPILWSLVLGKYPEEPPISKQAAGGHMRMITGYNDETGRIIFSDSWGAGHEMKRMTYEHAYKASSGVFTMTPTVR